MGVCAIVSSLSDSSEEETGAGAGAGFCFLGARDLLEEGILGWNGWGDF